MGYMSELLGLSPPAAAPVTEAMPSASSMHAKLVKADFHGSILTGMQVLSLYAQILTHLCPFQVRQSKNPCLVGLSGIMIHETENAFKVITRKDQLRRELSLFFALRDTFNAKLQ
jgi:ribonuclease P protein subunit POP4